MLCGGFHDEACLRQSGDLVVTGRALADLHLRYEDHADGAANLGVSVTGAEDDRFRLPESKSASVSQIISQALESGLIKADEKMGGSRKFAWYLPFWA